MNDTISSLDGLSKSLINASLVSHQSVSTETEKLNIRENHLKAKPFATEMSEDYANYSTSKYVKSTFGNHLKLNINNDNEKNNLFKKKIYKNLNKKKIISGSEEMYNYGKETFNTLKSAHIYHQNYRKDMIGNKEINNYYLKSKLYYLLNGKYN